MKLIFATGNENKMREIREIMEGLPFEILSMKEAGLFREIDETGETFEENALLKVLAIGPQEDAIILADDSGLSIAALGGGPGVHSSRFLGTDTPYAVKNRYLLDRMAGLRGKERAAWYTSAVAMLFPDGSEAVTTGKMVGEIALKPAGTNGFGYDPIFFLPEYQKTAAEITPIEKNRISHRGEAFGKVRGILREYLEKSGVSVQLSSCLSLKTVL